MRNPFQASQEKLPPSDPVDELVRTVDARFERREMIAERVWLGVKITVIILGIVGSVWGIRRIRQSRHEQACMAQAITWLETGIQLSEAVQRAKADLDHPTRGLLAVSEALYNEIDAQIGGGL